MRGSRIAMLSAVVAVTSGAAQAALTVPFVENFATTANWSQNSNNSSTSRADPTLVSGGGPDGASDSFIQYARVLNNPSATSTITLFRGQDNFDSSGDSFVGNWIAGGVTELSYFVRHNAPTSMNFGLRLAINGNSPGNAYSNSTIVAPNTWTKLTFQISPDNPNFSPENGTFQSVTSNVANVQVFTERGNVPQDTTVTFDLDKVAVTPEPAAVGLLGVAAAGGLLSRRRRGAARA